MIFFIPIIIFFLLWVFTGFYLATQYQKLFQQVFEFRERVKRYVLENGTTDEKLYKLVIESSRDILPSNHSTNIAKSKKSQTFMSDEKKLLAGMVCGAVLGVAIAVPVYIFINF
ncbi:hypothetical protein [Alteromonas gracilis]|uniref:hypothetical protein n=1 Tax=Alteromonas gracilis TaxID=1479524 RepID=UPI003736942F